MKAKLKPLKKPTPVASGNQCLQPNSCRYSPKLNTDGRILCSATVRTYMSRFNVCCSSSNLIYCITCELKVRFSAHFLKITKIDQESEIARHFNSCYDKGLDDVFIHIVNFIYAAPDSAKGKYLRDLLEFNWIQRLNGSPAIFNYTFLPPLQTDLAMSKMFFFVNFCLRVE